MTIIHQQITEMIVNIYVIITWGETDFSYHPIQFKQSINFTSIFLEAGA
jgi:hypothetical protein